MTSKQNDPLRIKKLLLRGFRNYDAFNLEDISGLTIIVGRNGIGKTNILEAISLMTSAYSFRHSQINHLIKDGSESGRIKVELSDGNRQITSELSLEPGKKRYIVNGKTKAVSEIRGVLPAVTFTPDDLELAKKSSSVKRDSLDNLGVQLTANYSVVRRDYEKVIKYKNRLLKDEAPISLIESINETLVTCGSQLFCYRNALISRLLPIITKNYSHIVENEESLIENTKSKQEKFSGIYIPSWDYLNSKDDSFEKEKSYTREEVRNLLQENLERYCEEEQSRKRSLVGPHNDKIFFYLDDRDVSDFASQGQQRSIVLAWKLAEVELINQSLGVNPVLLLDDVMSELDNSRREMLVRFVTDEIQTFISATDLANFNQELLTRAKIIELPLSQTNCDKEKDR